ncbi:hypothetical protein POM88_006969 [Heracleum sosnowskyi]|uniref:Transposase (putative) gypsy type domain-containing protein n=1 Tax=Heracleum sosnowskyi TaxID=360622 RepID=A0AAD8J6I7_9APIA|nr:hypothetical protein POM88_006969 [Heracleum sosnowskyi]
MVRIKRRANRVLIPDSEPSTSSQNSDSGILEVVDLHWCIMAKKKKISVITQLNTNVLADRGSLITPDGYWVDSEFMFVRKDPDEDMSRVYRSLSYSYRHRHENGDPGPYDKTAMDAVFADTIIGEPLPLLKESFKNMPFSEIDAIVRAAFHLGPRVQWRWPEPGERVYDKTEDGFLGVWLEHLRSGWNPECHVFVKHLCKYIYEIPITQITPNGVKWITWFLACCEKSELLPTFKLFHQLFYLLRSNKRPFYELRFRGEECGYPSGSAKPVMQNISLKGWNGEAIMLKGLDLLYMPHFVAGDKPKVFPYYKLEGQARAKVHAFCECLGYQLTRDTFMDHHKLFEFGCRPFYDSHFDEVMARNNYALSLRQLSGVHTPRIQKTGDESGSNRFKEDAVEVVTGLPDPELTKRPRKQKRKTGPRTPGSDNLVNQEDLVDQVAEEVNAETGVAKPRVGKLTREQFAEYVGHLPSEDDWKEMGDTGMRGLLVDLITGIGQVAVKAAGVSAMFKAKDDKLTGVMLKKDEQILDLGKQLGEMKLLRDGEVSGLRIDLSTERARNADLEKKLKEAEEKLAAVKPEADIIKEFQETDAYLQAVADAGAPEVLRSWKVAETLIKTNPEANWDTFVEAFLAAKDAIERGEGEPECFQGPNPLIFPSDTSFLDAVNKTVE